MALDGFDLTRDFGDPLGEARACRSSAALFDFSFIECVRLTGRGAGRAAEEFCGRPLRALAAGKICYAVRVNEAGEAVADLTIWKRGADCFEIMSGRREDVAVLLGQAGPDVAVADVGAGRAIFAVQGPEALRVLRECGERQAGGLGYFGFADSRIGGIPCTIGRLGYTGEAGFEVIVRRQDAAVLWQTLAAYARPAGFIAADALRIEAGFILFANEFGLPVAPAETGLQRFHPAAEARPPAIKLVCFRAAADRLSWPWRPAAAPRRPMQAGEIAVTSACFSGIAHGIVGLGYVRADTAAAVSLCDPAGMFRNIAQLPLPFYDTAKRRPRAQWRCHSQKQT